MNTIAQGSAELFRRMLAGSLVCLALVLTACGSSSSDSQDASAPDAAQALQERADELDRREKAAEKREKAAAKKEREARRAKREAREEARAEAAVSDSAPEPVSAQTSSGGITVPNVVGLDHQAAQNALQGEGLYNLDERDCTGQGRALLFDRNWEVQSIDPPAGTAVSEDDKITLCSVKQGEG